MPRKKIVSELCDEIPIMRTGGKFIHFVAQTLVYYDFVFSDLRTFLFFILSPYVKVIEYAASKLCGFILYKALVTPGLPVTTFK